MGNTESDQRIETATLNARAESMAYLETCKKLDRVCLNFIAKTGICYDCGSDLKNNGGVHNGHCFEDSRQNRRDSSIWHQIHTMNCNQCTRPSVYESSTGALCEDHAQELIAGQLDFFPRRRICRPKAKVSFASDTKIEPIEKPVENEQMVPREEKKVGDFHVFRPDGTPLGTMKITPMMTIGEFKEAVLEMEAMAARGKELKAALNPPGSVEIVDE